MLDVTEVVLSAHTSMVNDPYGSPALPPILGKIGELKVSFTEIAEAQSIRCLLMLFLKAEISDPDSINVVVVAEKVCQHVNPVRPTDLVMEGEEMESESEVEEPLEKKAEGCGA